MYGYRSTRWPSSAVTSLNVYCVFGTNTSYGPFLKSTYSALTPAVKSPSSAFSPVNTARGRRVYGRNASERYGCVIWLLSPPMLAVHHEPRPLMYALDPSSDVAAVVSVSP